MLIQTRSCYCVVQCHLLLTWSTRLSVRTHVYVTTYALSSSPPSSFNGADQRSDRLHITDIRQLEKGNAPFSRTWSVIIIPLFNVKTIFCGCRLLLQSAIVICYCHLLLSSVAVVCYQGLFEVRVESGFARVRLPTDTQKLVILFYIFTYKDIREANYRSVRSCANPGMMFFFFLFLLTQSSFR